MLKKSILVSAISNLSDARYCSGMGVEYLGVCVDQEEPSFLPVDKFNEINGWLSGINWILQTTSRDINAILEMCQSYDVIGVRTENVEIANKLDMAGINVLLEAESPLFPENLKNMLGVVIDFRKFPNFSDETSSKVPIYVKGDFSIQDLKLMRDIENIHGVILSGGVEERPGFKNMDDLIDALEVFEE